MSTRADGRIGVSPSKEWFQTFPQWSGSRESILELLKPLGIERCQIAEETHSEGGLHYHAQYELVMKKSKPQLMRYFRRILPDSFKRCTTMRALEPAVSGAHVANYLQKEDDSVLVYIRPPSLETLNRWSRQLGVADYDVMEARLKRTRIDERMCAAACAAHYLSPTIQLSKQLTDLMEFFTVSGENLFVMTFEKGIDIVDIFISSCKDYLSHLE